MSARLYVGNLPSSATESDLLAKFGQFGRVVSVTIPTDVVSGHSKRFGFVEMASDAEAQSAINHLSMTQYDEVTISVNRAK